ncbi:hypothetical protein AX774_g5985 [Zancudomyces culisetae]|uniref:Uncharacterized protein n=1 Tax=Zancudomyces culisetae TaxID=1213189 RepID=A0A1R1PHZ3_ZANCU|nr:hypothetical protein AX774_g5985 [Zancudomyces culisetae]|eukprot:OMH80576.1 hypothetical protein AX774_g5985 [Zancudomyces culisetae]
MVEFREFIGQSMIMFVLIQGTESDLPVNQDFVSRMSYCLKTENNLSEQSLYILKLGQGQGQGRLTTTKLRSRLFLINDVNITVFSESADFENNEKRPEI